VSEYGVSFIVDALLHAPPRTITLAVTGPMTNVALALVVAPDIASRVAEIVIMGGARAEGGNITASAEYNVYADPHAAQIVFSCGAPITVFGLDATHQVRSTPERIARLRDMGTPAATASADLLQFSADVERNIPGVDGAPLHDPCTIAYLLAPELFEFLPCVVQVETNDGIALGHTAVEFRNAAQSRTRWARKADGEGVFSLLMDRLGR
jgi:purine nucleosidase